MQEKEDEAIREAEKNKETRELETYHNQLLDTLNDAGLVKRIREEERRLKNAATAPTPPTPLYILPATVTPQVKRNALVPQARRTQEPQRTELQQAGNETEPKSLSMIMDLPPLVELPTLPPLPANKQSDQHGEEGNTSEKEEEMQSDALTLFATPFVSDMDVRRSRNIKRAEAMFVKLGLHILPQQLAATSTPTKPRKKRNNATSQASRKSKRVRVGAATNHDEEESVEPQLRDSPEKEAKRDEARVVFDDEWESNGATKPDDRGEVENRRQGYFYDDGNLVWLIASIKKERIVYLGRAQGNEKQLLVHWVYKNETIWQKAADLLPQCQGHYDEMLLRLNNSKMKRRGKKK
jgi:hypothetical protein